VYRERIRLGFEFFSSFEAYCFNFLGCTYVPVSITSLIALEVSMERHSNISEFSVNVYRSVYKCSEQVKLYC
jgi:hypothetical protein